MVQELAEVTCLACGRDLGKVERLESRLRLIPPPESPSSATLMHKKGSGLVCGRCGGRALVGPMEKVINYAA